MATKTRAKRPNRDQVRAWLNTVIDPLLRSLRVEREFLSRPSWTFRPFIEDFEYLTPTANVFGTIYRANADQLARYVRRFGDLRERHDRALDALRTACRAAFDDVVRHDQLQALVAGWPSEEAAAVASYVVNGVRTLPSHYTRSAEWNRRAPEFLAVRKLDELSGRFTAVDESGRAVALVVEEFIDFLSRQQADLADAHGLPAVEPDPVA